VSADPYEAVLLSAALTATMPRIEPRTLLSARATAAQRVGLGDCRGVNEVQYPRMGVLVLAAMALVSACGGATSSETPDGSAAVGATTPPPATSLGPTTPPATDPVGAEPSGGAGGTSTAVSVEAFDTAFDTKTIEAPANSELKVTLTNTGELPHDIAFYDKEGGSPLVADAMTPILQGGESATVTFTTPGPGTYFFLCLVHPQEMTGSFVVK